MSSRQTVFLERQSYRLRRRGDAMRLLPVLGIILMMFPLLWTEGPEGMPVSRAMMYIFGVWAGLAVTAGLLSRGQAGARSAALPADGILAGMSKAPLPPEMRDLLPEDGPHGGVDLGGAGIDTPGQRNDHGEAAAEAGQRKRAGENPTSGPGADRR
ncbi:hypothetical protein [Pseudooceanicola nanhaiensis]|uniref:hypothetical protein n=1 Tax=Pseudooceanicola nanhaiensis TaxID=375761 RepID=UPI001CD39C63|nr:hypothetical protein [Pseudooceanicola nanhaiensis]MCA0919355.1 hypothetical protein [Pseudooceanicola nanhaiensis]